MRAILDNPRYTGYAFFGRWTKHETLLDPDDVAAGHVTRFRRSNPERIVRSRTPAHPEIVPVEDFTRAQLLRRSKASGGLRTARKTERSGRPTKRTYLFRGRIRCAVCTRKMEGSPRAHGMYYRCPARTLAPGSPALADHPPAVYLREDLLREAANAWIGKLFAPGNVDKTVQALLASQDTPSSAPTRQKAQQRLTDAEARLRHFQDSIAAGVDPAAVTEAINEAQAERAAAQAELNNAPAPHALTDAEIYAMIDSLGDVGAALASAKPDRLTKPYEAVDLQVRYEPDQRIAQIKIHPANRVNSVRVRGASCALTTRLRLPEAG